MQEIIPARARVRNHPLVRAVTREDDPIRPRAASGVDLVAAQDGELIVRARVGEVEPFVIVVRMRILVVADGRALGIVVAALLDSSVDVGLVVARPAALIDALPLSEGQRGKPVGELGKTYNGERIGDGRRAKGENQKTLEPISIWV